MAWRGQVYTVRRLFFILPTNYRTLQQEHNTTREGYSLSRCVISMRHCNEEICTSLFQCCFIFLTQWGGTYLLVMLFVGTARRWLPPCCVVPFFFNADKEVTTTSSCHSSLFDVTRRHIPPYCVVLSFSTQWGVYTSSSCCSSLFNVTRRHTSPHCVFLLFSIWRGGLHVLLVPFFSFQHNKEVYACSLLYIIIFCR